MMGDCLEFHASIKLALTMFADHDAYIAEAPKDLRDFVTLAGLDRDEVKPGGPSVLNVVFASTRIRRWAFLLRLYRQHDCHQRALIPPFGDRIRLLTPLASRSRQNFLFKTVDYSTDAFSTET